MTLAAAGKVHGSLARAGKVRGQTPKVAKADKKKNPKGRAAQRIKYNRRFVNVGAPPEPCAVAWQLPIPDGSLRRSSCCNMSSRSDPPAPFWHVAIRWPSSVWPHSLPAASLAARRCIARRKPRRSLEPSPLFLAGPCSWAQCEQRLPICEARQRMRWTQLVARSSLNYRRLTRNVCCDAVAGFGKKRGPNSNPTS